MFCYFKGEKAIEVYFDSKMLKQSLYLQMAKTEKKIVKVEKLPFSFFFLFTCRNEAAKSLGFFRQVGAGLRFTQVNFLLPSLRVRINWGRSNRFYHAGLESA